jgi:YwiC-like protein
LLALLSIWRDGLPARPSTLVWPREHGAWGILIVALATRAATGFSSTSNLTPLLWLALAALTAFCLRTPIENAFPASPFRPRNRTEWRWVIAAGSLYFVCCTLAVVMLWHDGALRVLWELAFAATVLFALQAVMKRAGKNARLTAEMIGAFGLALAAAAGWAVGAGKIGEPAAALWLLNGLFAANQILYVQFRIRETRNSSNLCPFNPKLFLLASETVTALALFVGARANLLPTLTLLAFLPVFVRGGAWALRANHPPLRIHRLGKTELAHAILFGVLLIAAFRIP